MLWVKQCKGTMQECFGNERGSGQWSAAEWPHGWREGVASNQEETESSRNNQGKALEEVNFPFYLLREVKERLELYWQVRWDFMRCNFGTRSKLISSCLYGLLSYSFPSAAVTNNHKLRGLKEIHASFAVVPQTAKLQYCVSFYSSAGQKSNTGLLGWKQGAGRAVFPLRVSNRESVSLHFPASRGHAPFFVHSPFSHLESQQFCISVTILLQSPLHLTLVICLPKEPTHWERLWCWERLRARGEGDDRVWDGWIASPTLWTWVWANSGNKWRTGKAGVL